MSRTLSGIRGVPFRKIIGRSYAKGYVVETLSCGHKLTVTPEVTYGATKRRCYHRDCKIKSGENQ